MHQLIQDGKTPKAQKGRHCSQCSLLEECQPELTLHGHSVKAYLARMYSVEADDF